MYDYSQLVVVWSVQDSYWSSTSVKARACFRLRPKMRMRARVERVVAAYPSCLYGVMDLTMDGWVAI